jgi:hypothetical protein
MPSFVIKGWVILFIAGNILLLVSSVYVAHSTGETSTDIANRRKPVVKTVVQQDWFISPYKDDEYNVTIIISKIFNWRKGEYNVIEKIDKTGSRQQVKFEKYFDTIRKQLSDASNIIAVGVASKEVPLGKEKEDEEKRANNRANCLSKAIKNYWVNHQLGDTNPKFYTLNLGIFEGSSSDQYTTGSQRKIIIITANKVNLETTIKKDSSSKQNMTVRQNKKVNLEKTITSAFSNNFIEKSLRSFPSIKNYSLFDGTLKLNDPSDC